MLDTSNTFLLFEDIDALDEMSLNTLIHAIHGISEFHNTHCSSRKDIKQSSKSDRTAVRYNFDRIEMIATSAHENLNHRILRIFPFQVRKICS